MTIADRVRATFLDKDGSYAMPEIIATCGAIGSLASSLWDCFGRGHTIDLTAMGAGLAAIVLALGSAQRIRDGIWKPEGN